MIPVDDQKVNSRMSFFKSEYVTWLIAVIAIIGLAYDNSRLHEKLFEMKIKHQDSFVLADDIAQIKKTFVSIDVILHHINQFSTQLQMMANIKSRYDMREMITQAKQATVKNPQVLSPLALDHLSVMSFEELKQRSNEIEGVRTQVEELKSEATFQEQKLGELVRVFEKSPSFLASIPFIQPAKAHISSPFGFRKDHGNNWHLHEGVDIAAYYGTSIIAPADGFVEKTDFSPSYGRHVIVDHGYGLKTTFAHASRILVRPGDIIKRGDKIGLVGGTGRSRGIHLHYEVSFNGIPIDPRDFMLN